MKNERNISKKVFLGLLLGGAVVYCLRSAKQKRNPPILNRIGKTIVEVGEALENWDGDKGESLIERIESGLPTMTDWLDCGLSIWKKIKKG